MDKDFTLIQVTRTWIRMDGDPDRMATGFSVGHLPESSAITPGGIDTFEDDTKTRISASLKRVCAEGDKQHKSRSHTP